MKGEKHQMTKIKHGQGETGGLLGSIFGYKPHKSASRKGKTGWGPTRSKAEKDLRQKEKRSKR